MVASGKAPLIVNGLRRVRRNTSTYAFQRCDTGRAGMPPPSEAVNRKWPSDLLPRFVRERVPTSASRSASLHQAGARPYHRIKIRHHLFRPIFILESDL
jgi:hypothetical protein